MTKKYILEGREPKAVDDVLEWVRWYESADRRVALDALGDVRVSTVFLGLDHRNHPFGRPLVFESMVFGGPLDQECERYATWDEAMAGHAALLARVRGEGTGGEG